MCRPSRLLKSDASERHASFCATVRSSPWPPESLTGHRQLSLDLVTRVQALGCRTDFFTGSNYVPRRWSGNTEVAHSDDPIRTRTLTDPNPRLAARARAGWCR